MRLPVKVGSVSSWWRTGGTANTPKYGTGGTATTPEYGTGGTTPEMESDKNSGQQHVARLLLPRVMMCNLHTASLTTGYLLSVVILVQIHG